MYALWYVHGSRANLRVILSQRIYCGLEFNCIGDNEVVQYFFKQVEHLLGPMIGAALSGLICCKMTPEDPISYKRRNNSNDLGNFLESKKKWLVK